MCHCSKLYYVYNNNYNNNYSFVILKSLQSFCKPHLYFVLRCSNTQLHTILIELQLTVATCCLLCLVLLKFKMISQTNVLEVESICSRLLENFIAFIYVHSHTCLSLMCFHVNDITRCFV